MAPFRPISRLPPGLAAAAIRPYVLAMADETKIPAEKPEVAKPAAPKSSAKPAEHGGPKRAHAPATGKNGRCIDF
jgi:hypothetical protein